MAERRRQRRTVDERRRVAIVVSRYNGSVTGRLLQAAERSFASRVGSRGEVEILEAPGAYELPGLALAAARTGRFQGVLALGCLIKGDTSHDKYIAHAVAQGLVNVTITTDVPCAFGVLTVDTAQQAEDRAGGVHGNKGQEAMDALLDTIEQIEMLGGCGARRRKQIGASASPTSRTRNVPDKVIASRGAGRARKGKG
jgi:6,7-dimethyl-8-ribityllumazine synthase